MQSEKSDRVVDVERVCETSGFGRVVKE